jgi:hypothetical protein
VETQTILITLIGIVLALIGWIMKGMRDDLTNIRGRLHKVENECFGISLLLKSKGLFKNE